MGGNASWPQGGWTPLSKVMTDSLEGCKIIMHMKPKIQSDVELSVVTCDRCIITEDATSIILIIILHGMLNGLNLN